jgi:hypothetical protein
MAEQSHFSGPSAFWALTPLALAVMLQPSGRPCGFHFCHRVYLRAHPLVCGADALSIVIRLVVNRFSGLTWGQSAAEVFESRYKCCEYCKDSFLEESHGDLEKQGFLQILTFLYGTAPSIKLLAVSGMPVTFACAIMYLADYFLIWFLVLLADWRPARPTSTWVTRRQLVTNIQHRRDLKSEPLHRTLGHVALFLPGILYLLILASGFKLFALDEASGQWYETFGWMTFGGIAILGSIHTLHQDVYQNIQRFFPIAIPFLAFLGSFYALQPLIVHLQPIEIHLQVALGIFNLGLMIFSIVSIVLLFRRSPFVRKYVFFLKSQASSKLTLIEYEAAFCFLLFITMSGSMFSWFYVFFDAETTSKPIWLEVLG